MEVKITCSCFAVLLFGLDNSGAFATALSDQWRSSGSEGRAGVVCHTVPAGV